jgi:dTDP-4-amino-4,6-dideoxygalactose transaminase
MKILRTRADLAINGAPPAFDVPIHVGRPNIGDKQQFLTRIGDMLDRAWLTNNGPFVQEFEQRVAAYLGVRNCVATCNGTIALEIAIRALGLSGEVIIPSFTFIATAHALYWQGITPVFADIDPVTHNLDPASVRDRVTPRTTGIIGVHLWGRPASVEALQQIADEHGLKLLFDAAHAFGCTHRGKMIGSFGHVEVLSFHATKFFNTLEGGAIITNNDEIAQLARLMRNFGFAGYDNVVQPGTNGKMTEACAAMGLANLDHLDAFVQKNRENHARYKDLLFGLPGIRYIDYPKNELNNYQYVVVEITPDCPCSRDDLLLALHAENVLARKYFWPGCHSMMPYRERGTSDLKRLPQTDRLAAAVLVLPTGLAVTSDDIDTICTIIRCLCS